MQKWGDDDRYFVRLAKHLSQFLPEATVERTRDVVQFTCPEVDYPESLRDYGVIIFLMPDYLEVCLPSTDWVTPYLPIPTSTSWKRFEINSINEDGLLELVEQGRKARRRQFRRCKYCEKKFPPEHRHGNVCHGCAERELGVVH